MSSSPKERLDEPWDSSAVHAYFDGPSPDFSNVTGVLGLDTSFQDPHDFYRISTDAADHAMTSSGRSRQVNSNGPRTAPRPGFRSTSGPVAPLPASKSTSSLPSTNRPQVRNLVDRFNQPVSTTPAAQPSRYRTSRSSYGGKPPASMKPLKQSSSVPPSNTRNDPSPNKLFKAKHKPQYPQALGPSVVIGGINGVGDDENLAATVMRSPHRQAPQHPVRPSRPSLFGEISLGVDGHVDMSRAPLHPGDSPNAMHPRGAHNRTRSFQGSSPTMDQTINFSSHRKSRSEAYNFTEVPFTPNHGLETQPQDSPTRSQSPRSRIPIRKKRASGLSESGSSDTSNGSIGESRYTPASPPKDSRLPTRVHNSVNGIETRPKTPPTTLSSRRYGDKPATTPNHGSLQAVIRTSLPKTSPPLRTSRTRQPVSVTPSGVKTTKSPSSVGKDASLGSASFAARRNLFESTSQESLRTKGIPVKKKTSLDGQGSSLPKSPDATAGAENPLSTSNYAIEEPKTAITEFEMEDSPVLGMPGQFPENSPEIEAEADDAMEHDESESDSDLDPYEYFGGFDGASDPGPSKIPRGRRRQVPNQPSSLRNTVFSASDVDADDSESIQIMLGATPGPGPHHNPWDPNDSAGPSPASAGATFFKDEGDESPVDPFESLPPRAAPAPPGRDKQHGKVVELMSGLVVDEKGYKTMKSLRNYYQFSEVTLEAVENIRERVSRTLSPELASNGPWELRHKAFLLLEKLLNEVETIREMQQEQQRNSVSLARYKSTPAPGADDTVEMGEYTGTAIILEPQRYSKEGVSRAPWEQREQQQHQDQKPLQPYQAQLERTVSDDSHVMDPAWSTAATSGLAARARRANRNAHSTHNERDQLPSPPYSSSSPNTSGGLGLAIKVTAPDDSSHHQQHTPAQPLQSPPTIPGRRMPPVLSNAKMEIIGHDVNGKGYTLPELENPRSALQLKPLNVIEDTARGISPASSMRSNGSLKSTTSLESFDPTIDRTKIPHNSSYFIPVITVDKDSPEGKRLMKRRNLLRELYDTEDSFAQDMLILCEIYRDSSEMVMSDADKKTLFGNVEAVRTFSNEFKEALRKAIEPVYVPTVQGKIWNQDLSVDEDDIPPEVMHLDDKRDRRTKVGARMSRFFRQMEQVFGEYIKNHGAANTRLISLTNGKDTKDRMKTWMDVCIEQSNDLTRAWNLDALLVKPTQRILKYPLILTSLLECTPQDHPDLKYIQGAQKEILNISSRINENAKRAELVNSVVLKSRKPESKSSMSTALSRAFGRRRMEFKEQVGMGNVVDDPNYDSIAQRFGGHFFQLQIVMRDVEKYLLELEKFIDASCSIIGTVVAWAEVGHVGDTPRVPYPELESKWRKYGRIYEDIVIVALPEHKAIIQKCVIKPITELWKLHDRPQLFTYERKKNMADYIRYKAAKDKGEKIDKKLRETGELWEAHNETLKIELPILYAKTKKLVEAVLLNFADIQLTWNLIWVKKLNSVIEGNETFKAGLGEDLKQIEKEFKDDFMIMPGEAECLGICNRSLLHDTPNFLSPIPGVGPEDFDLPRRGGKRTQSMGSQNSGNSAPLPSPYLITPRIQAQHTGDGRGTTQTIASSSTSQLPQLPLMLDGAGDYNPGDYSLGEHPRSRYRSSTGQSSGSSTPRITSMDGGPSGRYYPQVARPFPSTATSDPLLLRRSMDTGERPTTGSTSETAPRSSNDRSSSIFSSAMPMSDSPALTAPETENPEPAVSEDPVVLFLAASLFEFNIAHDRREGGYPYLVYVPGEVFDVVGTKGELWLARNQDDPAKKIGWIWEKHFARILPDAM